MNQPHPHSPTQPERLLYFALDTVLPAAPPALWWSIGLGLFSFLNLVFQQEIWPHTPLAQWWFMLLGCCCGVLLPWQVARTAGRVADVLQGSVWRIVWRLASWSAYVAGAVALIPGSLAAAYWSSILLGQ